MQEQDKTVLLHVILERGKTGKVFRIARLEVNVPGIKYKDVLFCFLSLHIQKSSKACTQSTLSLVQSLIASSCKNEWLINLLI